MFAGTGNISFEFASRGSDNITSVDGDFGCVKFIKQIAEEYDFNIAAIKSDVYKFLEKNKSTYDIIFADPPYAFEQKKFETIVQLIIDQNLLAADGMMIIEHSKYTKLDHMLHFSFKKSYGGSIFSFFEFEKSAGDTEINFDSEEE